MIRTSTYDEGIVSPAKVVFFARLYRLRTKMPAMKLGNITDFSYDGSFGTDSTSVNGANGGRTVTTRNGDDEHEVSFTTVESLSVEAHEMLRAAWKTGELVEIWAVNTDITADGVTVLDANGYPIQRGWQPDEYYVGKINEMSRSFSAGDANYPVEWTMACDSPGDYSWVAPIAFQDGATEYPNASLKAYTPDDNPTNTVRDKTAAAENYAPSAEESQQASVRPKATGITFSNGASGTVEVGHKLTLEPVFEPADAYNTDLVFESSDDTKATVDDSGVVTGVEATGIGETVTISASPKGDDSVKGTFALTVN